MSKILSYNNKTTRSGSDDWVAIEPYSSDDIDRIKDPDGGLSEHPRTAIPSPFAQLDLVKNAFASLAKSQLRGVRMNERLVSNALDVAQLLFDFENHKDRLHIVRWNRTEQLKRMQDAPLHRLYGQTLQLFLATDKVYNFDLLSDWFIVMRGHEVLGGTSPSSLTMAVPAAHAVDDIMVEQGVPLFSSMRHLWQRDDDFIVYLYVLMNAHPVLRQRLREVYAYMVACLDPLRVNKPHIYERLTTIIPNLSAFDTERAAELRQRLDMDYEPLGAALDVNVLGARLYCKRNIDIRQAAASSDFVIAPTVEQPADAELPMVLRTGFNGAADGGYRYVERQWDSATQVLAAGVPMNERTLPDTAVKYPFITTADLLSPTLIRLSHPVDSEHFADGHAHAHGKTTSARGYLLPVTELYFRYFTAADLQGEVGGRPAIDIEELADGSVNVTLRVAVRKRHIDLSRRYLPIADPNWTFDEQRGTGRMMDCIVSAAVFPMVRTGHGDNYVVQQFTLGQCRTSLQFVAPDGQAVHTTSKVRSRGTATTTYYDVDGAWDYAVATIDTAAGNATGLIMPHWHPYAASARQLIMAVDFGTTNTHIEWAERGHASAPLTMTYGQGNTLVASLLQRGALDVAEQMQRIEFLPHDIDEVYGFPMRSALLRNTDSDGQHHLFHDVNIPMLYERQYFSGYDVTTSLKWMGDNTLAREFLREVVLLLRAKALLEGASPARTLVTYFYPVSMGGSDRRKLQDAWEELYRTYMGDDTSNLHAYPESIAPAHYYKGADVAGSSYVSIDIGGGTTDTVVYQPTADGLHSQPTAIASFRFAGNAIFGDAFTERDAATNPLIAHYSQYFRQLIAADNTGRIAYLNSIMDAIMGTQRSEDINAFMLGIENVEELRNLRKVDRNLYSYNALLRNDEQRKLVFIYFYAAIIYYVARSMHARNEKMPKQVYFSGTGSKILGIVGRHEQVEELTRLIFERVYGTTYTERFTLKVETECPKQITCRGGINLENMRLDGQEMAQNYTARHVTSIKQCYSMLDHTPRLTYAQVGQLDTRQQIVQQVQEFNEFFSSLCDRTMRDEMGIGRTEMAIFQQVVGEDLMNFLTAGINSFLAGRYEPEDVVEDVPFFYPIIGTIRYNLLKNLCNDVISRYNQSGS